MTNTEATLLALLVVVVMYAFAVHAVRPSGDRGARHKRGGDDRPGT